MGAKIPTVIRHCSGLALLEMVAVLVCMLVILGVLLARPMGEDWKLNLATQKLIWHFSDLRMRAVNTNRTVCMSVVDYVRVSWSMSEQRGGNCVVPLSPEPDMESLPMWGVLKLQSSPVRVKRLVLRFSALGQVETVPANISSLVLSDGHRQSLMQIVKHTGAIGMGGG